MAIFSWLSGLLKRLRIGRQVLAGIALGVLAVLAGLAGLRHTSSDTFCAACHVHPQATDSWMLSTHYKNNSGVVTHCSECHLPPGGLIHLKEKARLGIRDVFGYLFKDTGSIDWEERSALYHAVTYTYDSSCLRCHADLYSLGLSEKGLEAHRHYENNRDKLFCINCHKEVGHFQEEPAGVAQAAPAAPAAREAGLRARTPDTGEFKGYTEQISGTEVSFEMVAIPGGTYLMGSPETEPCRKQDEGPVHEVALGRFWIGETEVTWNEYKAFFDQTSRPVQADSAGDVAADTAALEAVTGPTPKYGSQDIGGWASAYSMTHYAAVRYCEWLSAATGKTYRLPTEAEWEYCARAGTVTSYFFDGDPARLTGKSLVNRLFGTDDLVINRYVFFRRNSGGQVQNPYTNEPNPWGLYNMLGNVKEFCLDFYAPDAYWRSYDDSGPGFDLGPVVDPAGPPSGKEHVVRGGSYLSDPADLRAAARGRTRHDEWLATDPHVPKSRWWYSDCMEVGFRVVREYGDTGPIARREKP
ncbi:MAG: SUMF1/EgtB/PvdO family nonheme iron enzyme [Candidatus Glassbacteria bacterium]|nr:SUMF1/EgtB/PvdO family nonheme iron enzyme [Candidatus Glassbacteria bacterium]